MRMPNLSALRDLPLEQKRTETFKAVRAAISLAPMAIEMLGTKAPAMFARNDSRFDGGAIKRPEVADIKSFLTGDLAAPYFGGTKWAVPADNPNLTAVAGQFDQFFHDLPAFDLQFMPLFRFIDMRRSNETSFDITSTNLGISWEQRDPGGVVKPRREFAEANTAIPYLTYAAALSIQDDWLRFNKFYRVEEAVNEFNARYFKSFADAHYGLFVALGAGINVTYATSDTLTFNAAVAVISRNLENKGFAINGPLVLDIVCSPERVGKVLAFLQATRGSSYAAFRSTEQPIAWSVRNVIVTTRVPSADNNYYLCVPEQKNQRAVWMDPSVESQREASVGATDWYGTAKFNAVIGDSDQVRRVGLSP